MLLFVAAILCCRFQFQSWNYYKTITQLIVDQFLKWEVPLYELSLQYLICVYIVLREL